MENERRKALIDQMLSAKTKEEVQRAEGAAETWLSDHPHDLQVLAAREHLDEVKDKVNNPVSWWSNIAACVVGVITFVVVTLLIGTNTGNWAVAIGAGLLTGGTLSQGIASFG